MVHGNLKGILLIIINGGRAAVDEETLVSLPSLSLPFPLSFFGFSFILFFIFLFLSHRHQYRAKNFGYISEIWQTKFPVSRFQNLKTSKPRTLHQMEACVSETIWCSSYGHVVCSETRGIFNTVAAVSTCMPAEIGRATAVGELRTLHLLEIYGRNRKNGGVSSGC